MNIAVLSQGLFSVQDNSSYDTQPYSLIVKLIWLVWFLLSDKEVKEHLSLYLTKARGLKPEIGHLLQVCQLFVHCWEVNFEFITCRFEMAIF